MKKKQIENLIKQDIQKITPDYFDAINKKIASDKQNVIIDIFEEQFVKQEVKEIKNINNIKNKTTKSNTTETKKKFKINIFKPIIACVCALVLVVLIIPVTNLVGNKVAFGVSNFIYIDINPSISIELDKDGNVTKINYLNSDAKILINGRESSFVGKSYLEASKMITIIATEYGYINPNKKNNAILVSAETKNDKSNIKLAENIKKEIENDFKKNGIYGIVLEGKKSDTTLAEKYKISNQKLNLILTAKELGVVILEEEYFTITISEIYKRMEIVSDILEEFGDADIKEDFDEFEDDADIILEDFEKKAEELIEAIEASIEEEQNEELKELLEADLEKLTDLIDILTDNKKPIKDTIIQIDENLNSFKSQNEDINTKIENLKTIISNLDNSLTAIETEVENKKNELIKKAELKQEKNKDNLINHSKEKDFDKNYEKWKKEAEKSFYENWNEQKTNWEKELDD